MKKTQSIALLLLTQLSPLHAEDSEQWISYPFVYEDTESLIEEKVIKKDSSKKQNSPAWQGKMGRTKVSVDVKNPDIAFDHKTDWENLQKSREKKSERRSNFSQDQEKDKSSPGISFSLSWPYEG